MRLGKCVAKNFGSYENLEIDFSDMGLALAYGPTGSGKSTLADLTCWAIFGITAKDGSVDDVRSWTNPGEPTIVSQEVLLNANTINITRVRGRPSENDLFWIEQSSPDNKIRGKDLSDTQKLLNARLGFDAETYLTAAYFHEFSDTGKFFTASAKDRRQLFDRICSMATPNTIREKAAEENKKVKNLIIETRLSLERTSGQLSHCYSSKVESDKSADNWDLSQARVREEIIKKSFNFKDECTRAIKQYEIAVCFWDSQQNKIIEKAQSNLEYLEEKIKKRDWKKEIKEIKKELTTLGDTRCNECGSITSNAERLEIQKRIHDLEQECSKNESILTKIEYIKLELEHLINEINPNIALLETAKNAENKYEDQLRIEQNRANPYTAKCILLGVEIKELTRTQEAQKTKLTEYEHRLNALSRLSDLSQELRGVLLKKAVSSIQNNTNEYLETYFDAEIKVQFTAENADNISINIQKNGYTCNYKQLSKGQRQLLKLSFVISIMKAASNKSGVHFDNLFMDEALDGLDTALKLKAFRLFESLATEHSSILMIDHASEFQTLFNKKFIVSLSEDKSYIE